MRISDWSSDVCSSDLDGGDDFSIDLEAVAALAERHAARLVFLCSPGNPVGGCVPAEAVLDLARRLRGRALVVVDEAYIEFADTSSLVAPAAAEPNIVVLRTLSKAHPLAEARVGCAIGDPAVIPRSEERNVGNACVGKL